MLSVSPKPHCQLFCIWTISSQTKSLQKPFVLCFSAMWNWPFKTFFSQLNKCVSRLRRVKMEKRILADQGNTLVDLCKVREASKGVILKHRIHWKPQQGSIWYAWCVFFCFLSSMWTHMHRRGRQHHPDAEPDVWPAVGGAGLQGGAGHTHPQPGEARGGAAGGLQEPDAAPVQHPVHAELLHPPPAQGEGGEDGGC